MSKKPDVRSYRGHAAQYTGPGHTNWLNMDKFGQAVTCQYVTNMQHNIATACPHVATTIIQQLGTGRLGWQKIKVAQDYDGTNYSGKRLGWHKIRVSQYYSGRILDCHNLTAAQD